jgi:hypothetical protein
MNRHLSTILRLVALVVLVCGMVVSAIAPASAEREPPPRTSAQQVRELVWKHREEVLARIGAILHRDKTAESYAQVEPAEDEAAEAEDADAEEEDGEAEDTEGDEGEEAEGEYGEAEDESAEVEVEELPDAGSGRVRTAASVGAGLISLLSALTAIGLRSRRLSV